MSQRSKQPNTWIAYLPKSRSVIEITSSKNVKKGKGSGSVEGIKYQKWGDDDKLPDEILQFVNENDFMPSLLKTDVNFLHGGGLMLMSKRLVPGVGNKKASWIIEPAVNKEMTDWARSVFLDDYYLKACYQYSYSNNTFTGYNLNPESKIKQLTCYDFPNLRAEVQNEETGQIDHYLIFGDRKQNGTVKKVELLPRYRDGIEKEEPQFIFHSKEPIPGQGYYAHAPFYGAKKTIKLLNMIPDYHISGIENGYNIKYHVKVPDVWLDSFGTQEEKDKAWEKLREDMDEQLSGTDNVNKTILSKFVVDRSTGKPLPGFDIVPIDNKQTDEAYLKLYSAMRISAGSSVGIHPGLANLDTGGKLGGTASEMRVAAQLHLKLRTPIARMIILKPVEVACKIMGFPDNLFFAPVDFELQTLDKNPTGNQTVTDPANAPL